MSHGEGSKYVKMIRSCHLHCIADSITANYAHTTHRGTRSDWLQLGPGTGPNDAPNYGSHQGRHENKNGCERVEVPPVEVIGAGLPYDNPYTYAHVDRFWYRLEKLTAPAVQKNHFP
jgi:hypothetical protein